MRRVLATSAGLGVPELLFDRVIDHSLVVDPLHAHVHAALLGVERILNQIRLGPEGRWCLVSVLYASVKLGLVHGSVGLAYGVRVRSERER